MKNYFTIALFLFLITMICTVLIAKWDVIETGQKIFAFFAIFLDFVCIAGGVYDIKKGDK